METVECVVVGAGPAGLRAAQVLADAGRDVLVLEKREEIGPKTCAGGLSSKAVRELEELGLPPDEGLEQMAWADFRNGPVPMDPGAGLVRTLSRRELGRHQAAWARRAGAELRTGVAATAFELEERTLRAGDRLLRWTHLIGADGSSSSVRRALGLPAPRHYLAAEFNIPDARAGALRVAFDPDVLANGYFWVFPHRDYVSVGAGVDKRLAAPRRLRPYLERRVHELGLRADGVPFEAAAIEVEPVPVEHPGGVHLAGDAAGMPSGLTAEGIYAALVTGEEAARRILEPGFPSPKTREWLRVKRWPMRWPGYGGTPAREA